MIPQSSPELLKRGARYFIDLKLFFSMKSVFSKKVIEVVKKISKGHTMSYKEVAILAGSPFAFRAVGNILNKNYDKRIPCHRIVRSDGSSGGYNRGSLQKMKILKKEGAL